MPGRCSCAGQSCNCLLVGGSATTVSGTGAVGDPYAVSIDLTQLGLGAAITVADSSSLDLSKTGSGGTGDPVIISGSVRLFSPDGSAWRPSIDNSGAVSWSKS